MENDWVKTPIAITNHRLFELDPEFVSFLNNVNSESNFLTKVNKCFNLPSRLINGGRESRLYSKLESPEESLQSDSWCHSMTMKDLVKYTIPSCLKETKCDAIIQYNCWWTDGHIETGGKDSISVTPIGEKLYFICTPGVHSVNFEKRMRKFEDFSTFISDGPESSLIQKNVFYYIPKPDYILCQPSLCAHAVLTSSVGVSFVWGWEACNMKDFNRAERTLRSYGTGIRHEGFKSLLNYAGTEGALQISQELDKRNKIVTSGLTEHLYAFSQSGQSVITSSGNSSRIKRGRKPGVDGANKRKKRSFRFPANKDKYIAKRIKEEG